MAEPQKKPVPMYLRGMPTQVVREAKAAAARKGITLAGFVAETLAHALEAKAEGGSSARAHIAGSADSSEAFDDEVRWYEQNRERLARKYPGEFIAIVGQRVIDHDAEFEALASRMFEARGPQDTFMPQVRSLKRPLRVRSPRLARPA